MFKFLAWSQIPYLIFFIPVGVILLLKQRNYNEKTLLVVAGFSFLPAIYTYSFASDSRYLFALYPIFSVISIYTLKLIMVKINKPRSITVLILLVIVTVSTFYLQWKDIDADHELESFDLAKEISNRAGVVNAFPTESSYLNVVGLTKVPDFPTASEEYLKIRTEYIFLDGFDTIEAAINAGKQDGLTHLVADDQINRANFIKDVFVNENRYPYLIKEFDSAEHGYKYHLKIFKINYEKFNAHNDFK
jgi:hypothetical protein